MNDSWKNSNSSPGFVYFNTSSSSQQQDDSNQTNNDSYIAFDDNFSSPTQNGKFSPSNYSSPMKYQQYKTPKNNYNNFNKRGGRFQNRHSGGNNYNRNNRSFNNSFCSPNSSYNNSWKRNSFQHNRPNSEKKVDISRYLHMSCMEDPWKKLEEQLKEKQKSEISVQSDNSSSNEEEP